MTNPIMRTAFIGALLLLSACDAKPTTSASADSNNTMANPPAGGENMAGMDMTAKAKTGSGHGIVKAVDAAAGKITLDHGPIPEASWPAMTMTFDAKPAIMKGVSVGDKVAFDLTLKGTGGEVTEIRKEP